MGRIFSFCVCVFLFRVGGGCPAAPNTRNGTFSALLRAPVFPLIFFNVVLLSGRCPYYTVYKVRKRLNTNLGVLSDVVSWKPFRTSSTFGFLFLVHGHFIAALTVTVRRRDHLIISGYLADLRYRLPLQHG